MFWKRQNERYLPNVPGMYLQVKGYTFVHACTKWFSNQPEAQAQIMKEFNKLEANMHFRLVPGVKELIRELKPKHAKIALIISLSDKKSREFSNTIPTSRNSLMY